MSELVWFVLWECFCTDISQDAGVFPERCPCHDTARIGLRESTPGVSANLGHMCGASA